jgi:hypothetical protein
MIAGHETDDPKGRIGPQNVRLVAVFAVWGLVFFALWYVVPKSYEFSDPVFYAMRAYDLPQIATWEMDHPFDHRLGLLFSHWLAYATLGVNEVSSFLPQFAFLLLLLAAGARFRLTAFEYTLYALGIAPLVLQAFSIFPDLPVAALVLWAVSFLSDRKGFRDGILFALLGVAAFLFKLTAYWLIVPLLTVLIFDVAHRRADLRFYGAVFGCGFLLMAGYLLYFQIMFSDPLLRLKTVSDFGTLHHWSIESPMALINRLFFASFSQISSVAGILLFLAFAGCALADRSDVHLVSFFLGSLALLVFGSTSFQSYQPLPLFDRMLITIVPPAAILGAKAITAIGDDISARNRWSGQIFLAISSIFIFYQSFVVLVADANGRMEDVRQPALRILAENLSESNEAHAIIAEPRTRQMLGIFLDFSTEFKERTSVCPAHRGAPSTGPTIYYADRTLAEYLATAYGDRTCTDIVRARAIKARADIIYDSDNVFLAIAR